MAVTSDVIGKAVLDKFGGELDDSESTPVSGPFKVGSFYIWQIWTMKDDYFHTRHAVSDQNQIIDIYPDFHGFANWLSERQNEFRLIVVRIYVAVAIVAVALGLLVFLVVQKNDAVDAAYLMTALVGGAVAYLLGDWVRKK